MRQMPWLPLVLIVLASPLAGQTCTTYVVVPAIDPATHDPIDNLQPYNFEARMGGKPLPVVSATQGFASRLLVLVEVDLAGKNVKIGDVVDLVARMAREAPEGKPVAFGVFADHAIFTDGFHTSLAQRRTAIGQVLEEGGSLGKRVALYDALHDALLLFGPHQPGDTILLIGEPYDDKSRHSAGSIEHEFAQKGTRLSIMLRQPLSNVSRDFLWKSHNEEREFFESLPMLTGGAYTDFKPSVFESAWKGYLLGIEVPENMRKARSWHLRLRGKETVSFKRPRVYYPESLLPCSVAALEKGRVP